METLTVSQKMTQAKDFLRVAKIIFAFLMIITSTFAQAQSLKKIAPEGSKVYILLPGNHSMERVNKTFDSWGFWKIVNDRKEADFVLKIVVIDMSLRSSAYAELVNKNNETVYITASSSLGDEEETIVNLIHKRIIEGRN